MTVFWQIWYELKLLEFEAAVTRIAAN